VPEQLCRHLHQVETLQERDDIGPICSTLHLLDSISVSILWTQLFDGERAKIGEMSRSEDDQPVERSAIELEMAEMLELETERRRRIQELERESSRAERGGLHSFKAESIESYKGKISSSRLQG
jgi:hypothetical protein